MAGKSNCEFCAHYAYDEEDDCYYCDVALDEDDIIKFYQGNTNNCNFFKLYDEYGIVRKQN